MTEDFLHYVWKHKLFNTPTLRTVQGASLVIIGTGIHNHHGGPDFLQARIRLDDQLWVGNVEIHIQSSDWQKHGHQEDRNYKNIILHVVYEDDAPVFLHQPGDLPVLVVAPYLLNEQWARYQQWMANGQSIACQQHLTRVDDLLWNSFRDALIVERMEQKSQLVLKQLQLTKGDWNESFYRLCARYFGGKVNGDAMALLIDNIPFSLVMKLRSDPFQIQALFYGMSGMLDGIFETDYPKELQREFQFLMKKHSLQPLSGMHWQFFGLRPVSFPTIRIGQFTDFLCLGYASFPSILEAAEVDDLKSICRAKAPEYWMQHTMFDKPRQKILKGAKSGELGELFVLGFLINVVAVSLFAYGRYQDDAFCLQRALLLLDHLEVEDNRILRMWRQLGVEVDHAADAQAMIQLFNQYCAQKRCLHCRIGVCLLGNQAAARIH
jgi:Protein of unknown function (DUF2851)